ncbi:MAG: response regulator, partial [Alphaproteobacteria bacterium]|nr:response regulator [Alphaproteobacteria bacterium]
NTSVKNLPALLNKVSVLVVDSDVLTANIIKHVLNSLGFGNIIIEHDSNAAAKIIVHQSIDLVITDMDMTLVEDEMTLVEFIRNSPESPLPYIPIILLTGHTELHDIETARDQGITEIASKPFTAKSLCDRIIRVIENPRSFIITKRYTGPDRRRRDTAPPDGTSRRKGETSRVSSNANSRSPSILKRLLGKKS